MNSWCGSVQKPMLIVQFTLLETTEIKINENGDKQVGLVLFQHMILKCGCIHIMSRDYISMKGKWM